MMSAHMLYTLLMIGAALAGEFAALWLWLEYADRRQLSVLQRDVSRLIAQGEVNAAAWARAQARYRSERAELLAVAEQQRSELADVRLTAMAREQQIREQIAESRFGEL